MDDDGFVRVAASAEVGAAPFLRVQLGDAAVLLARLDDGTVRAFASGCPHTGQPLTHAIVTGRTLECPFHLYAYDLDSGRNTFPGAAEDAPLPTYAVREADGAVWLRPRT